MSDRQLDISCPRPLAGLGYINYAYTESRAAGASNDIALRRTRRETPFSSPDGYLLVPIS